MKKFLLASAFLFLTSTAQAGMYVSGGIGWNFKNDSKTTDLQNISFKYDDSALLSAAVGYAFPVVRVELEGLYNKSDMKNVDSHMTTGAAFINAYARIPVVGIYAGAGAGYASVKSKKTPVYQGMLGVEYGLGFVNLGVEYRHIQSSKDIKKFNEKSELRNDALLLKMRFEF
ncbi:outer membrane beta-barrel protein [bacterium]|nr:outer membrane beta-barrel protein [Alphaproteobacteria bacterium]MBR4489368.1 outer membrane beta-barrel protein [bacterium]